MTGEGRNPPRRPSSSGFWQRLLQSKVSRRRAILGASSLGLGAAALATVGCEPGPVEPVGTIIRGSTPTPPAGPGAISGDHSPDEPIGFPVDPNLRPMQVIITPQGKRIAPPAANGPTILQVAREYQTRPQNDEMSNRYGWNCRLHTYYEGAPAVDWYLPEGTPLFATMRGQAELYFITTSNAFEYYGMDGSVTLGLPDPSMPRFPLPGPGGGMGIFVSILNGALRAEYGHLELRQTISMIQPNAYVSPFGRSYDYHSRFGRMTDYNNITLVARWNVQRGDVVGFIGNTGYSDVAHVHYQVVTRDRVTKYCPTEEQGGTSAWLFGRPANWR